MKMIALREEFVYKLLNKILLIIMNIGTIIVAVIEFSNNNYSRVMTFVAIYPLLLLPFIINKTKFKLSEQEVFLYYLFILLADFIGCVCNLYNTVSWYDIFVHFLSGIFTFVLATIIFRLISKDNNKLLKILFSLGMVALIAIMWEVFEFSVDSLIHTNLQHNQDTGVIDTMQDMIVAMLGGLISSTYMWIKK